MNENNKLICKNCGKKHDGSFGKGIFCSRHCASQYAGKKTQKHDGTKGLKKSYTCEYCGEIILGSIAFRQHINICPKKEHTHYGFGNWKCNICGEVFISRRKLQAHRKVHLSSVCGSSNQNHYCEGLCQYCGRVFKTKEAKTNHEKYCINNPNRIKYKGHPHSEESKKKLSKFAKENNFGGWHTGRKVWYKGVLLGSSYEEALVKDLDKNNIKWEKPSYFKWISPIDNKEHRYYPDIYLPDYNIYFDPKNDYLIENENPRFGMSDLDKIKLVESQNNIKVFVLNKEQLTWNYIKNNIILD
jgi:hypothetical protein